MTAGTARSFRTFLENAEPFERALCPNLPHACPTYRRTVGSSSRLCPQASVAERRIALPPVVMPIIPFLRGQVFDPELIEAMSTAFTKACDALGLVERADPIRALVARQIIELAERGFRTQTELYFMTLEEFKANPQ